MLKATGAPRGSIYHHFPDGKDQLVAAALELARGRMLEGLERLAGATVEEITDYLLRAWRAVLTRSNLAAGCAVVAVTVAADSPALLEQAAGVFRAWRRRLGELLEQAGLAPVAAARFAATLIATTEGAVVLSRAEQSLEPFALVGEQLLEEARRLATGR